jgi:predicted nucleic acid-binding protein
MAVVDASVLASYLVGGDAHAAAVRERLLAAPSRLWAPHLVDAEVGHVLRREVRLGNLKPGAAGAALRDLAELPIRRAAHVGLLERAWALRANLTFYDALYVALAELIDLPLLTLDARLAKAPGIRASVEVIA